MISSSCRGGCILFSAEKVLALVDWTQWNHVSKVGECRVLLVNTVEHLAAGQKVKKVLSFIRWIQVYSPDEH